MKIQSAILKVHNDINLNIDNGKVTAIWHSPELVNFYLTDRGKPLK